MSESFLRLLNSLEKEDFWDSLEEGESRFNLEMSDSLPIRKLKRGFVETTSNG
jgi:hypothetical protein